MERPTTPGEARGVRGFTLIELIVVVAIVAVLATLAYSNLWRQRPRAQLAGASVEVEALLRNARQNALSTGRDTVLMIFPNEPNSAGGRGRIVVVEDRSPAGLTFFSAAAPQHFGGFAAGGSVNSDAMLGSYEFPRGITLGLGGAPVPALEEPYKTLLLTASPDAVAVGACSFCGADRGAVVFDARGRARFYQGDGDPLNVFGGTIALNGAPDVTGYRLIVITAATGGVRGFNNG